MVEIYDEQALLLIVELLLNIYFKVASLWKIPVDDGFEFSLTHMVEIVTIRFRWSELERSMLEVIIDAWQHKYNDNSMVTFTDYWRIHVSQHAYNDSLRFLWTSIGYGTKCSMYF